MDMKQVCAAGENRPAVARFELEPHEPSIPELMGMTFRTFHFDGVLRVPRYVQWPLDCEMRATYAIHRDALKFVEIYPNAKFLWSHRDPAKALGAVYSLITAVRLTWRAEGIERAMDFPRKFGGERFVGRLVRRSADQSNEHCREKPCAAWV